MQAAFEPSFKRLVVVIAGEDLVLSLADRLRLQITVPYIAYNWIQIRCHWKVLLPLGSRIPLWKWRSSCSFKVARQSLESCAYLFPWLDLQDALHVHQNCHIRSDIWKVRLISADSVQVYRGKAGKAESALTDPTCPHFVCAGLDIGSNKPSRTEQDWLIEQGNLWMAVGVDGKFLHQYRRSVSSILQEEWPIQLIVSWCIFAGHWVRTDWPIHSRFSRWIGLILSLLCVCLSCPNSWTGYETGKSSAPRIGWSLEGKLVQFGSLGLFVFVWIILDLCFSQAASLALLLPRPCTAGTWMKEAMRYGPSCCVGNILKTNTACNKIDSQSNSYITKWLSMSEAK